MRSLTRSCVSHQQQHNTKACRRGLALPLTCCVVVDVRQDRRSRSSHVFYPTLDRIRGRIGCADLVSHQQQHNMSKVARVLYGRPLCCVVVDVRRSCVLRNACDCEREVVGFNSVNPHFQYARLKIVNHNFHSIKAV